MNLLTYILIITHKSYTTQLDAKQRKDKQEQFVIQPKTKHKTGLIFMKSQNKQRQRPKLRILVFDKHFEVG